MLNLVVQPAPDNAPLPYAEAVSRLASVRHALRLVEPFIAAAWDGAGEARQRQFDRRSERMIGAAAAGIEALLVESREGREPHSEASQALVEEIRRELRDVAGIVLG
jgi:hypothetical protein